MPDDACVMRASRARARDVEAGECVDSRNRGERMEAARMILETTAHMTGVRRLQTMNLT